MVRNRIIDRLREKYPGIWRWDAQFAAWFHEDGWRVQAYSRFAPKYDGDDDSFDTEYRRSDTGELVLTGLIK